LSGAGHFARSWKQQQQRHHHQQQQQQQQQTLQSSVACKLKGKDGRPILIPANSTVAVRNDEGTFWLARLQQPLEQSTEMVAVRWYESVEFSSFNFSFTDVIDMVPWDTIHQEPIDLARNGSFWKLTDETVLTYLASQYELYKLAN
jgi:hypothetical protein